MWINIGHFETVHELRLHDYPIVEHFFDEYPVKLIKLTDIPETLEQEYFTLDVSIEYTKEIKVLLYWQDLYTCAIKRFSLFSSTIEALWEYFYKVAIESGEYKDKARASRLHDLLISPNHPFCYLTKRETPWLE